LVLTKEKLRMIKMKKNRFSVCIISFNDDLPPLLRKLSLHSETYLG